MVLLVVERRRRVVTLALPPRGEHGGCRLPDFDYATNVRAAGELYHTGAEIQEKETKQNHSQY